MKRATGYCSRHPPFLCGKKTFLPFVNGLLALQESGIVDFRNYFEENPDEVRRCAEMVKIIDVNQATLSLFKVESKEQLLGNLAQVFGDDSYTVFREEILSLLARNHFTSEIINRTIDGEEIHVSIQLTIAPDAQESWTRVFVSLMDITARKHAEDELVRAHADLEQRVQERTADLSTVNAQLQRTHEFSRFTLESLMETGQRGVSTDELLEYVRQAQDQLKQIGD